MITPIGVDTLSPQMRMLAEALSAKHGNVHVTREKNGLHLYMSCPACVEKYGKRELRSRHMSVNMSKRFGVEKWKQQIGQYDPQRVCNCMKEHGAQFSVDDLLTMPSLEERGVKWAGSGNVLVMATERKCIIKDERGNIIPDHPGEVTPVTQLPQDHPAIAYLLARKLPPSRMFEQFRCSYCWREAQEDTPGMPDALKKNRWYKQLPHGFKDTSQNRLIFYADMFGVQLSWQARILDWSHEGVRYYLHPYTGQWCPMERKNPEGKWEPIQWPGETKKWDPQKYKNAFSSQRNEVIYGFDAARRWNEKRPFRLAIVTEGPPDAGRFGPPGMPITGRYVSPTHAQLIQDNFDAVVCALQNDEASRKMAAECMAAFVRCKYFAVVTPPAQFKDFGEMDDAPARARLLQGNINAPDWVRQLLLSV